MSIWARAVNSIAWSCIGSRAPRKAPSRFPMMRRVGGIFSLCRADRGTLTTSSSHQSVQGRYVRVLMRRPTSPDGYILSELEVYGRGGFVAQAKPAPAARPDGRLDLAGGAWRLQRDSLANADGAAVSKVGFADNDWVIATVPGTVLSSYLNVGAIPDPNYGENQLHDFRFLFLRGFLVPQRVHGAGICAGPACLAELRRDQLEGGCLSEWRETRPHRGRLHARPL